MLGELVAFSCCFFGDATGSRKRSRASITRRQPRCYFASIAAAVGSPQSYEPLVRARRRTNKRRPGGFRPSSLSFSLALAPNVHGYIKEHEHLTAAVRV